MWYLERIDPLPSLLGEHVISFVGAGGKTSLAEYLGQAAAAKGKAGGDDNHHQDMGEGSLRDFRRPRRGRREGPAIRADGQVGGSGKTDRARAGEVAALGREYDLVLVEADGAKGRPLKYPAAHEPVIPPCSGCTVVVAGLDALGRTIAEAVFRSEQFMPGDGIAA